MKKDSANRNKLLAAARQGDEDAIETLTLEDMDMYTTISRKIQKNDIFSLVDTYFMPYGVECDQYSVLGEITEFRLVTNDITGEKVYILTILCNELTFDVCINEKTSTVNLRWDVVLRDLSGCRDISIFLRNNVAK